MLDGLAPEDLDELAAFDKLEPDPLLRIVDVLKAGLTAIANAGGAQIDWDRADPQEDAAEEQTVSPERAAALMAMRLGR